MPLPERLEFRLDFPTDSGFLGRECNNLECRKYFKVHVEDIKDYMHCPYCGNEFPNDELWTTAQLGYVEDTAAHEVLPLIQKELADVFERAFRGSKNMRFERSRPSQPAHPSPPEERKVDSELSCPDCGTRFQVDGIFGYCPGCRAENVLIYDADLSIIRREISSGTATGRALRHAYSDLVSAFEIFCRKEANRRSLEHGRFQNLEHTRRLFKNAVGIDITARLTEAQKRLLKRVFQKRHLYEHNEGIVNDKYVAEIPEDAPLFGQKAPLSLGELEEAASVLRLVLTTLVDAR